MIAHQTSSYWASDQALAAMGLAEQERCVYTSATFWPVIQLQGIQLCSNSCSWRKQMRRPAKQSIVASHIDPLFTHMHMHTSYVVHGTAAV